MTARPLPLALAVILAFGSVPAGGEIRLPTMGDPSQQTLSSQNEQALGDAFMRHIRQQLSLIDDPELHAYLEQLGRRLASASDRPDQRFTFFLVDDSSINAFAAPGGYIGVHSGLLLAAESESELAAVLAHEIAHVTQRHIARAVESASRMGLPTAVALLAAVLLATQSGEAGQAALMSLQAGAIQRQIDFTRANEKEADRIGMQVLGRAGYDPAGMPGFFGRLRENSRFYRQPPPFLSTHPVTSDRIAEARDRAARMTPDQPTPDPLQFRLMQAKLKVLQAAAGDEQLQAWQETGPGTDPQARLVRDYGLALQQLKNGDPGHALEHLERLLEQDPERLSLRLAAAEAALAAGKLDQALHDYEALQRLYPGNPVVAEYQAAALLKANRPAEAQALLSELSRRQQVRPELYRQLANAAGLAGARAEAHSALAAYYREMGDLASAREQLRTARRLADLDAVSRSRLDAELQRIEDLMEASQIPVDGEPG